MKILFCYKSAESLGLEYLSAVLKKAGHETVLAFDPGLFADKRYLNSKILSSLLSYQKKFRQKIIDENPDIVAFSIVTDYYSWACETAQWIKSKMDVPIVFGGIHTTIKPEETIKNSFVDYVVMGEAEYPLLELVNSIRDGEPIKKIKNICYKENEIIIKNELRPYIEDLNDLPFPDKALFEKYIPMNNSYWITASRGCIFNCSYCHHNALKKIYPPPHGIRLRSPDNVIKEIIEAGKKYKFKNVDFQDDLFAADKKWAKIFLPEYKKTINLPFKCTTHPSCLDEEVIELLSQCGCKRLMLGVQSLDDSVKSSVLLRTEENKEVTRIMELFNKYRLHYSIDHIFGIPGETEKGFIDSAMIYIKNKKYLDRIKCFYLSYYPGTDIIDISSDKGAITLEEIDTSERYDDERFFFNQALKRHSKKDARRAKNFEVFYKIIPLLPYAIIKIIMTLRLYRLFFIIPWIFLLIADLINGMRNRDFAMINYIKYYYKMCSIIIKK